MSSPVSRLAPTEAAWSRSVFGALPESAAVEIRQGSTEFVAHAGDIHHSEQGHLFGIVTQGFLRIQVLSISGRQATIRYAAVGDVVGLIHLLGPSSAPQVAHALEVTRILRLSSHVFLDRLTRDATLGSIVTHELAAMHIDLIKSMGDCLFGTIRQRVARTLLAVARHNGNRIVCRLSHQHLAEAVGTVREVATRALRSLEREHLLRQEADGVIELTNPTALLAVVQHGDLV